MSRRDGFLQWPLLFCLPLHLNYADLRLPRKAEEPTARRRKAYLGSQDEARPEKGASAELPHLAEIRPSGQRYYPKRLFTEGSDVKAGDVLWPN